MISDSVGNFFPTATPWYSKWFQNIRTPPQPFCRLGNIQQIYIYIVLIHRAWEKEYIHGAFKRSV
jgi:hypothetical protein